MYSCFDSPVSASSQVAKKPKVVTCYKGFFPQKNSLKNKGQESSKRVPPGSSKTRYVWVRLGYVWLRLKFVAVGPGNGSRKETWKLMTILSPALARSPSASLHLPLGQAGKCCSPCNPTGCTRSLSLAQGQKRRELVYLSFLGYISSAA